MAEGLTGFKAKIAGRLRDIFSWPILLLGIDPSVNPSAVGTTAATSATGTLTSNNTTPTDGDVVSIGGQIYTLKTTLTASTTANQVLINGGADAALLNLIRAINGSGTPGTDYGSLTVKNQFVSAAASVTSHHFAVTSLASGVSGNAIATTATSTGSTLSWSASTLTGGTESALKVDAVVTLVPTGLATNTGANNLATSQVTSTGSAATLVAARPTRRSVCVRNTNSDATKVVYVGPATVTSGNGFPIYGGEALVFTWVGLIQVIDDGSNHCVVAVADEYD